ncbi:uncharacterized protein LOC143040448 [Oratosquilla oratoria]|uniref:uncharacterized protein LOC143040448 n=1 Tax=Oratosquilla oratoria TaxID=337810 RepID=UPI003F75C1C4
MAPQVSATLMTPSMVAEVLVVTAAPGTARKDNCNNTITTSNGDDCCGINECPLGRLSSPADRGATAVQDTSTPQSNSRYGSSCSSGSSCSRRSRAAASPSVSRGTSRYTSRLSSKEVVLLLCLLSLNSGE